MRSRVEAASQPVEILSERLRKYASMYVVDGGKKCSFVAILPCTMQMHEAIDQVRYN